MLNGAYFTPSGAGASASYARASSLGAKSSSMVGAITSGAGPLACRRSRMCQYSQLHLYHLYRFSKRKCPFFSFFLLSIKFPFLLLKSTTLKFSQIKVISHCLSMSINHLFSSSLASVLFLHCQFQFLSKSVVQPRPDFTSRKAQCLFLKQVQKRCPCPVSCFIFPISRVLSLFIHWFLLTTICQPPPLYLCVLSLQSAYCALAIVFLLPFLYYRSE